MSKQQTTRLRSKQDAGAFGIIICLEGESARHSHYPLMHSEAKALAAFAKELARAEFNPDVFQVQMCRYTTGRTELVDEWVRDGRENCTWHREIDLASFQRATRKVA